MILFRSQQIGVSITISGFRVTARKSKKKNEVDSDLENTAGDVE